MCLELWREGCGRSHKTEMETVFLIVNRFLKKQGL